MKPPFPALRTPRCPQGRRPVVVGNKTGTFQQEMLYVDNQGIAEGSPSLRDLGAYRVAQSGPKGVLRRYRRSSGQLERPINPVFSRVESGDGRKREQGDSDSQSRDRSGNQTDSGRAADRQSAYRYVRYLAGQGDRRAQGKDREASRRDFQRRPVHDRRAISDEGRQGLYRGPVANPQMDRPERRRKILDRSSAAELQLDPDHARWPQRWRRWQFRVR